MEEEEKRVTKPSLSPLWISGQRRLRDGTRRDSSGEGEKTKEEALRDEGLGSVGRRGKEGCKGGR